MLCFLDCVGLCVQIHRDDKMPHGDGIRTSHQASASRVRPERGELQLRQ